MEVSSASGATALQKHDIGQDLALFYIAYAAFLELRRNYGKAEAVFKSGLDRYRPDYVRSQSPCLCMPPSLPPDVYVLGVWCQQTGLAQQGCACLG